MSIIFNSLTSEPLAQVVNCISSFEVWQSLKNMYESTSTARIANIRMQMQQLKKEDLSIHNYLGTLKSYSDQLAAVGEPVKIKDYV